MKRLDYEQLSSLPLFLGIDGVTLTDLYETVSPVVSPMRRGTTIITEGEECRSLVYVLEGQTEAITSFGAGKFSIREYLRSKSVIEPQCLFGLHTTYTRTYTAVSPGYFFRIPKSVIVRDMMPNDVFRFNFINLLSSSLQDALRRQRHLPAATPEARLAEMVARQVIRPAGTIELKCKMWDIAPYLSVTRLNLSRMLHRYSDEGLLEMYRGGIVFPLFERFEARVR